MRTYQQIAAVLRAVVEAELDYDGAWLRGDLKRGIRRLAAQAQQIGMEPDVALSSEGRDAFRAIARAIFVSNEESPRSTLRAEWQLVVRAFEEGLAA